MTSDEYGSTAGGDARPIVVVPTFNERDNLPALVEALLAHPHLRVLIVDDASPDGTGDLADQLASRAPDRIEVLHRRGRRGLGRSYVEGMMLALTRDVTHVCQMDGDLSHDPADVPRLVAAAREADLVIGSRYVPGGRIVNWPRRRHALSAFANLYVRVITRLGVHDCTSGFRCWRRDALARLPLDRIVSDGYAFQVEMTWHAFTTGCRLREVPITFVERRSGTSKLSARVIAESVALPWRLAAQRRSVVTRPGESPGEVTRPKEV